MKVVIFALVALCISTHALEFSEQMTENSNAAIAKYISKAFVNRLQKQIIRGIPAPEQELRATLLPPADDPAFLPTLEIPLNISTVDLGFDYTSTGHLTYTDPEVTGLSKLVDDFTLGVVGKISVVWNLDIPKLAVKGPYKLDQVVDAEAIGGHHVVSGEGPLLLGVDDVFFKLNATGTALLKLHIDTLEVDLGFKNLTGHAENLIVDGEDVGDGLDSLIGLVETLFGVIWTDTNKVAITEMIRCSINHLIDGCTLGDITGGKFECLADDLDPTCFGIEPPTTVAPSSVSTASPSSVSPTVTIGSSSTAAPNTTPKDIPDDSGVSSIYGQKDVFLLAIATLSILFFPKM